MKKLYFEGAGCTEYNGINCRIRTGFTDKDGVKKYIEMWCKHTRSSRNAEEMHWIHVDCICSWSEELQASSYEKFYDKFELSWTAKDILRVSNRLGNADFEEIEVLDNLAGFRAFKDKPNKGECHWNMGDEFQYDEELTKKRRAKVEELKEKHKKLFHKRFDNTSYWVQDGELRMRINVAEDVRIAAGYDKRDYVLEV